jgi:hypothetical protein
MTSHNMYIFYTPQYLYSKQQYDRYHNSIYTNVYKTSYTL